VVARFRSHWEVFRREGTEEGDAADGERFRSEGTEAGDAADGEPPAPPPDRVGAWMLAAPRPGIVGRNYFALIGATASSIVPRVVDLLAALPEVDPDRIAIAGSSTHGFVALEALRGEPRLAAGVVRVACADYRRFLRSSSLALNDDPRWLTDGELVLDADYAAELAAREPIGFAADYPPRPVLMLNGARDPAVPEACARRSAEAFRDAYRAAGVPERFRFVLYPDAGHDLGPRAADEVLAWWERWLLGGLAGGAVPDPPPL
jgi:pimeloyl-ACP methyl ester carboxylesterase